MTKQRKKAPRIKRERLWAAFNHAGILISSAPCEHRAWEVPFSVYANRQEAEADCCEEAGDFVAEVVLVRAPKRKGLKP